MDSFFSKTYAHVLLAVLTLFGMAALGAYAHFALSQANMYTATTISVSGEGEVVAVPDIGQFTFSVRAEGEDAASAQEASATAVNEILAYLEEAGIEDRDIKTVNYQLNPRYRYEERVCAAGSFCPPGEQILDGFEVNQTVQVKVRDTEAAGDVISGVGGRGATDISGLNFTIDDMTELEAEARAEAITNAREKAEALAEQLGMRIARIAGYYEEQFYPQAYGYGGDMMMEEASFRSAAAPSLPTGENTVRKTVNVTYELR